MKRVKFVLLAASILVSATAWSQKYHDAENDGMKGHVKSVTTSSNGETQTVNYSVDGKTQQPDVSNPVYNSKGYMTSCDFTMMGYTGRMTFTYNSSNKISKQVLSIEGGTITQEYTYNSNGTEKTETTTMSNQGMSQSMTISFTYDSFDSHGNWTRRTGHVGGQSAQESRTIVYW